MHPVLFVFAPTNRAVVCFRQRRSEGVLLLAGQLGEVPLGLLDHHAGQSHQGDQVGDGHEAVEGIGDGPGQVQLHGRTHKDDDDEKDLVRLDGLVAEQELAAAGAIQGPAQDGGKGEQSQAHRDDDGAALLGEDSAEGSGIQRGVALGADVQVQTSALGSAQDGQTGQSTNQDGVHEDLEDAIQALLDAVGLRGSSMGDRSGTEAGLVGEHAALDAPGDDQDHGANDTTGDTAGGEGTHEDVVEHGGQGVGIADDHDQAGHDCR